MPGTEETLRVHDTAELTTDPATLDRPSVRQQPAPLAILVRVARSFFHCPNAFERSRLWQQESWPADLRISFGKILAPKMGGGAEIEQAIDQAIAEDYKTNL